MKSHGAPDAISLAVDVADEAAVRTACDAVCERFGRLDVVVNVAGAMIYKPITELSSADWTANLAVNLMGPVHFTTNAFRLMKSGGAIVNVASVHACQTSPLVAPYAAAKAALLSLTRTLSHDLGPVGITVNMISGGLLRTTDASSATPEAVFDLIASSTPLRRVTTPAEFADAALFFASPWSRSVTGQTLVVDGGRVKN